MWVIPRRKSRPCFFFASGYTAASEPPTTTIALVCSSISCPLPSDFLMVPVAWIAQPVAASFSNMSQPSTEPFSTTSWSSARHEPSLSLTNAMPFCTRTVRAQPLTVTSWPIPAAPCLITFTHETLTEKGSCASGAVAVQPLLAAAGAEAGAEGAASTTPPDHEKGVCPRGTPATALEAGAAAGAATPLASNSSSVLHRCVMRYLCFVTSASSVSFSFWTLAASFWSLSSVCFTSTKRCSKAGSWPRAFASFSRPLIRYEMGSSGCSTTSSFTIWLSMPVILCFSR
mmetsp:Transcript_36034/g.81770  ORF Transcript_36034/g.81770 Transcript_36034/m.81770 type:complete len:286 (+) Transcript_36034:1609-2466(+)